MLAFCRCCSAAVWNCITRVTARMCNSRLGGRACLRRRAFLGIRDLKHQDGRHDDGIPEVYFPFRSCAEPEKLTAIRRRPVVGDGTFAVLP